MSLIQKEEYCEALFLDIENIGDEEKKEEKQKYEKYAENFFHCNLEQINKIIESLNYKCLKKYITDLDNITIRNIYFVFKNLIMFAIRNTLRYDFKEIVDLFLKFLKPIGNFINYLDYITFREHRISVFWNIMSTLWRSESIEMRINLMYLRDVTRFHTEYDPETINVVEYYDEINYNYHSRVIRLFHHNIRQWIVKFMKDRKNYYCAVSAVRNRQLNRVCLSWILIFLNIDIMFFFDQIIFSSRTL